MRSYMIILHIRKFFDCCVEFILCTIIMLIYKIIFQCIEISFHDQCTARSVNDMKRLVKTGVFMMLVLMILASQKNVAEAKTKVIYKKMTIDLNRDSSFFRCTPTKLQKYSKVKVCVKNRKVLKAKAKGRKYIVMK